jgi:hypothetical protein
MPRPRVAPSGARIGGLPTYTKEQFKLVRPKGSYDNYLKFIKTRRGITSGPAYPGRGGPGLPTYVSMLRGMQFESPAQLEARANRMTKQQMGFQQGMLRDEYKRAQDDAMRRMLAFQAAGRSAAAMNASLIGQVGGQYQAGADQLSQMASAGAASMAAGTQGAVDSANAAAANVGMPGVTVGGPVGQPGLAGPTQAGVESYYGGTIPAQMLGNAGGYASAGMAGQISAQNLRATQEAQAAYMQAMGEAGRSRSDAMRELVQGRPSMAAEYLLKLQDSQRQQYALAMSLIEGRRNALQTGFGQRGEKIARKQTATKLKMEQRELAASLRQARQEANLQGREVDEARSVALGYYVDALGRPITRKNGKQIKVPKAVTDDKTSTTPVRQQMAQYADDWLYRHRNRQGGTTGSKQQLVNYLLTLFPGNPQLAKAIAASVFPKGGGGSSGGGALGAQP